MSLRNLTDEATSLLSVAISLVAGYFLWTTLKNALDNFDPSDPFGLKALFASKNNTQGGGGSAANPSGSYPPPANGWPDEVNYTLPPTPQQQLEIQKSGAGLSFAQGGGQAFLNYVGGGPPLPADEITQALDPFSYSVDGNGNVYNTSTGIIVGNGGIGPNGQLPVIPPDPSGSFLGLQ